MDKKLGFIGCGNMGGALVVAACKSINPNDVIITDYFADKAAELAKSLGCCAARDNAEIVNSAEFIVLAVKPNVMRSVIAGISEPLKKCLEAGKKRVLITIAAGLTIASLKEAVGIDVPMIRIMPNLPATVGEGMILTATDPEKPSEISAETFEEFTSCIAAAGKFDRIDERAMNATTSVPGCGPAFAFVFIEALADGAVQCGVPRAKAYEYAAQALKGAAEMVLETKTHPGELKDMVCSPGGSTIVGVTALEEAGFRNAAIRAVLESTRRNEELGK